MKLKENAPAGTWLVKSEPETYSIESLAKDKKTFWNGVRNFQARNYLAEMRQGDTVIVYHSGKDKSVVGLAKVAKTAHPEPVVDAVKDAPKDKTGWLQVELQYCETFANKVSLKEIKANKKLSQLLLIKQSRLSVMPITRLEFDELVRLAI